MMTRSRFIPLVLVAVLALAAPVLAQGTYTPDEEGWVPLFNGENLDGWRLRHDGDHGWTVEDGILTNTPPSIDLVSTLPLEDIELHVEFRVPQGGNSGVYLQGRFEIQVGDSFGHELNAGSGGALYSKIVPSENANKPAGEWQTYDIQFRAPRVDRDGAPIRPAYIRVVQNDILIIDSEFEGVTGGAIDDRYGVPAGLMLQGDHSGVEYRDVRYRPLQWDWAAEEEFTSLFDGESLAGWKVSTETGHGSGGAWDVVDGVITGTQDTPGNGGILITDADYGDYEVRFEMNPDWNIDSGFFLRCTDDGRCYQVTVDYRPDGEVGTIYGEGIGAWLQPNPEWYRYYKPHDWNDCRVIISGEAPRIQVWLNSHKIIDFVDTEVRLPAEEGIAVQVHGGGDWDGKVTRFRNIRVRPLGEDEIAH